MSQELLLAEKWARMNKLPFPKIDSKVFDREGLKECYVFKPGKGERNCPTILHFVLVNINFREFKAPGKFHISSGNVDVWRENVEIWGSGYNYGLSCSAEGALLYSDSGISFYLVTAFLFGRSQSLHRESHVSGCIY